jgi:hypothetical protein
MSENQVSIPQRLCTIALLVIQLIICTFYRIIINDDQLRPEFQQLAA